MGAKHQEGHAVQATICTLHELDKGSSPFDAKRVCDHIKGDDFEPEYRSRWVAQEVKTDRREDLFAATPPLEAIKLLLSYTN